MTLDQVQAMLLWCVVLNFALLLPWSFTFMFAHGWVYRLHSRWFPMSPESFNTIHYAGIAFYKIILIAFFLIPYVAICLVR